jgi:uncharacterized protein
MPDVGSWMLARVGGRRFLRPGFAIRAFAPVLLLVSALPALAVDWKALKPQGYVSDFAGVIDAQSKAELENYAARVEQQTGAQMALVTIRSLDGEPIEDVANAIYRAWGVGKKGKDEGILLLLAVSDRRSRLEVGYGLEPVLPDGFDGEVLRAMRPALRQSQYGEAMRAAAATLGTRIAQSKGVTLDTSIRRRTQPRPQDSIPWPLVIIGIVVLFSILRGGRGGGGGFLQGILLGSVLSGRNRGWGGGSSGGFGGYDSGGDSGGGFGGFGGGDSGGGGASSDW